MNKLKVLVVAGLLAGSLALLGNNVLAKNDNHGSKPGWGHGDENHEHTGPPGGTSVRPGDGDGDDNHHHTGPPGKSVNPGEHEHENEHHEGHGGEGNDD